ncbi:MAG: tripartite tricarboxylate transporter substrate binding protein [Betaproteobacteria bacterium]|nr:tripartite tricarboxylate transporter substrate binding protein [Betaproteobacteria bacterium]
MRIAGLHETAKACIVTPTLEGVVTRRTGCAQRGMIAFEGVAMNSIRAIGYMLLVIASVVLTNTAPAQEYPAKPVRIIVTTTPASLGDLTGRVLAQRLSNAAKHPFVVENRPGGGGIIGGDAVAKAAPDGYTLLIGFHGLNAILPALGAKMPFDPIKDLAPVILAMTVPNVLVINPTMPVQSIKELVALAKAKPGTLTFASQGNGSSGHLAGELFRLSAGIDIVHVPYKGPAEAVRDLMSGQINMMFDVTALALPNVRAGKMRALAVATKVRAKVMPDLPTTAEEGLPDVEGGAWFALYAPAGTPRPVIDWLNREARTAFATEAGERLVAQGVSLPLGSPEDLAAFAADEFKRWSSVGRRAAIRLE